jgi:hypothetical protein
MESIFSFQGPLWKILKIISRRKMDDWSILLYLSFYGRERNGDRGY